MDLWGEMDGLQRGNEESSDPNRCNIKIMKDDKFRISCARA